MEPLFAERFTVHAMDRRGRRGSGEAEGPYSIEVESGDVAAVVDSLDEPADLFGHSYGATLALGAAPLARNLRRLILYEPAPGISSAPPALLDRIDEMLTRGAREDVLSTVMTEFAGFGPEELEAFRASPVWAPRVAAADTIPRELRAEEDYRPDPGDFENMTAPAMLLLGSESPEWARSGTQTAAALLPNSSVVTLEGQGHVAIMSAPDLLVAEVTAFLERE